MVVPRSQTYAALTCQMCNKTALSAYGLQLNYKIEHKCFLVGKYRENKKYERDLRPLWIFHLKRISI